MAERHSRRLQTLRPVGRRAEEVVSAKPWLLIATFCQVALFDDDRMLSVVKVSDTINIYWRALAGGPGSTKEELLAALARGEVLVPPHEITLVIRLMGGTQPGDCQMRIQVEPPDGMLTEAPARVINFPAPHHINNLIAPVTLQPKAEGMHWVRVLVDDELLARIPLRVQFLEEELVLEGAGPTPDQTASASRELPADKEAAPATAQASKRGTRSRGSSRGS